MTKKNANSRGILFPKDERTKLIRPLENTKEDYKALARCFNAFKDSDSWPEGFGGSLVFTGEYIEKQFASKDLSTNFIVKAPDKSGQIVGCGFCNRMWNLPNGWYVELFAVDPKFQKQKLGKALLLNATQYATGKKARIISLHTWPGNLKAMPLYKRQGYKWRPNTSVYMENYIPQILNYTYFYEFFSTNSWYEIFKPVITQEPNLEFDEKMSIYEYHFSADEKNSLTVWIDQTIGRICGFHKRSEIGEDLLMRARTPNSEAFIGLDEFPITFEVINNGREKKNFVIKVKSSPQITLNEEDTLEFSLSPSSKRKVNLTGKFLTNTDELNLKVYTHTYSNHEITFTVMDNGAEFPIMIGKVPINAIQVLTEPLNFNTVADSTSSVYLKLQNNMNIEESVIVEVTDGEKIRFQEHKMNTTISLYDTDLIIPIKILDTETMVDKFNVLVKTLDDQILIEKDLPVTIFNTDKAVSYEIDRRICIENKNVRAFIYKTSQTGSNEIFIEDKMRGTKVHGHAIKLGYPFDDEGSEFYTIDHNHEIIESRNGLWLKSSAESKIKEGIKVIRQIFFPNDNEALSVSWKIENNSEKPASDLGILVTSEWWEGRHPVTKYVYPFLEGIVEVSVFALPVDLGKDPLSFTEGWKATEFSTGTVGLLFDQNSSDIDKIHISHLYLSFEHKFDLKPGEIHQTAPLWYTFVDNWRQVRKAWLDKYRHSPLNKYEPYLTSVSHKRFGLRNKNTGNDIYKALFLDRSTDHEIEATIDAFRETTFKGTVELDVEKSIHQKFSLPHSKSRIWSETIKIAPPKDSTILRGK
ncbi:MAG: GNAT family N-acetyltransferase, partial [Candidatus Hodarchaeales archaeon]